MLVRIALAEATPGRVVVVGRRGRTRRARVDAVTNPETRAPQWHITYLDGDGRATSCGAPYLLRVEG